MHNKLRSQAEIVSWYSNLWRHFSLDPTLWGPIGQFLTKVMADRWIKRPLEQTHIQNLKKKKEVITWALYAQPLKCIFSPRLRVNDYRSAISHEIWAKQHTLTFWSKTLPGLGTFCNMFHFVFLLSRNKILICSIRRFKKPQLQRQRERLRLSD